ncbi:hypothetical protein D3C81_1029430 [compost metagenome]
MFFVAVLSDGHQPGFGELRFGGVEGAAVANGEECVAVDCVQQVELVVSDGDQRGDYQRGGKMVQELMADPAQRAEASLDRSLEPRSE